MNGTGALLSGLRIVEISSFVATPLCGMVLSQLGAEVIRVEHTSGGPDRGRWPLAEDGTSLYWTGLNRGKSAIAVDLKSDEGQELIADLVNSGGSNGGILISNTDRYANLVDSVLRQKRPDLVHVQLTGKNDGGTAVDYTVQAATGFPLVSGNSTDGAPVNNPVPAWDLTAGLYLATGLLAALQHRTRADAGSFVQVALEDVALATAGQLGYLADAQLEAGPAREADGNYVYGSFGRDFQTADDERLMVVALTPRQWKDLVAMTGLEDALTSLEPVLGADFSQEGDRYRHRDVLSALIANWFSQRNSAEVRDQLAKTRVLWSPYRSFADLAADDAQYLKGHPMFQKVSEEGVGSYFAPGSPLAVNGVSAAPQPAPKVGANTHTVLKEYVGLAQNRLERLVAEGIVPRTADDRSGPAA